MTLPTSKVSTSPQPLSAAGPSPLPGRLAPVWGTSHFLSSPDPSGPHSMFLFRPSARRGRENGRRRPGSPSWQLVAGRRYLFSRPRPRPVRAGAGQAGFLFLLKYKPARGRFAPAASPCSPGVVPTALFLTEVFLKTCSSLTKQL